MNKRKAKTDLSRVPTNALWKELERRASKEYLRRVAREMLERAASEST